jgi:TonB-linked SusC/RagA family outer membrane protein
MGRYNLTATVRRDGSSNFGQGNRWGTFPSAAASWRISEEPFMKDVNFIQNLKLRLGWGQTGNSGGATDFAVPGLSSNGIKYQYYAAGESMDHLNFQTGFYAPLVDTNLKWETNEQWNFGLDFGLLNGDLNIGLDYFIRTSKDLLLNRQIRASQGNTAIYTNYGEIENKGFEFAIGYHHNFNKDFSLNARLTGSTIKNKVKKMGDPLYNTASGNNGASAYDGSQVGAIDGNGDWNNHSICKEGEAVGSYYGYVTDGIIKDQADLQAYLAKLGGSESGVPNDEMTKVDSDHPLMVGDMKFKDINNDGRIDSQDRQILGNGFPALNYGLTVGATYKDWDFNLYMYGVFGQDVLSYSAMKMSSMRQLDDQCTPNILAEAYDQAFRNGNGSLPRLSIIDSNRNYRVSDMWVKNGDFLRISNLQVGYTLPQNFSKKLSIQKARIYLGVSNLLTISGYNKYGDPECGSGSVLYAGLDTGRYPQPRTFMGGINVTF